MLNSISLLKLILRSDTEISPCYLWILKHGLKICLYSRTLSSSSPTPPSATPLQTNRLWTAEGRLPDLPVEVSLTIGRLPDLPVEVSLTIGRLPDLPVEVSLTMDRLPDLQVEVSFSIGWLPDPSVEVSLTISRLPDRPV